jgi:hypothetical protein
VAFVAEDRTYSTGQVGLRVVNTHAVFSRLRIANDVVCDHRVRLPSCICCPGS